MAVVPYVMEALTVAVIAKFWIDMNWYFAFCLGFSTATVSPGILLPYIVDLQANGYGTKKKVPQTIISSTIL